MPTGEESDREEGSETYSEEDESEEALDESDSEEGSGSEDEWGGIESEAEAAEASAPEPTKGAVPFLLSSPSTYTQ